MTLDTDKALSDSLRTFYRELDFADKPAFEQLLQSTFGLKNVRNAQLWVTDNQVKRNFINGNLGALERNMREAFMRGILQSKPQESPSKQFVSDDVPRKAGQKLRKYLFDDYTRQNVLSIEFNGGTLTFAYESYGSGIEESNDLSTDEFGDIADE